MSDPYYPLAWIVYLASALALSAMAWYLTRSLRPALLRKIVRVTVPALAFTPAVVDADSGALAPAWLAFAFTAISDGLAAARSAWVPLALALVVVLVVVIVAHIAGWLVAAKAPRRGSDGTAIHQSSENNTVDR